MASFLPGYQIYARLTHYEAFDEMPTISLSLHKQNDNGRLRNCEHFLWHFHSLSVSLSLSLCVCSEGRLMHIINMPLCTERHTSLRGYLTLSQTHL